jgi:DNA-directed RNA polymerase specialized sigma24 family protein
MDDRDIVAAMRTSTLATLAGLAGAYDKYAGPLYSYCCWLLGEPETAAEVVRETFRLAMTDLRGIRSHEWLRPHLYAVARDECRQRQQATASPRPGPAAEGRPTDLRGFITDTLARLDDQEREVVELIFRHGLSDADLALVLNVPRRHASALATRIQAYLADNLAILIVAQVGLPACTKLSELLSGWDGRPTLWAMGATEDHIEECLTCADLRHQAFHPTIMYALDSPGAPPPADLRNQVIRLCMAGTAPAQNGLGKAPGSPGRQAKLGTLLAIVAIAIWVAAAVGVTLLVILGSHSPQRAGVGISRQLTAVSGEARPAHFHLVPFDAIAPFRVDASLNGATPG